MGTSNGVNAAAGKAAQEDVQTYEMFLYYSEHGTGKPVIAIARPFHAWDRQTILIAVWSGDNQSLATEWRKLNWRYEGPEVAIVLNHLGPMDYQLFVPPAKRRNSYNVTFGPSNSSRGERKLVQHDYPVDGVIALRANGSIAKIRLPRDYLRGRVRLWLS